ncbi:MAG TPA: antibiotic biosynthesis monooxygenase, partial [Bacteroidetes bacterium]|nr:antibiotic biosynthesis monooxygenase [Bacteroidota bacterium]
VDEFLKIFDQSKNKIASVEGIEELQLIRDKDNKSVFFTISKWRDESYLEQYRNSELFKNTWAKTKVLFNDKPEAWSTFLIFKS